MIPVSPVPEPASFDAACRQPGNAWLQRNPGAERPHDYWSAFRADLAAGFGNRCGYSAMYEPSGTIDHYESHRDCPAKTYEWSNYRFAAQWLNSSKKKQRVIDPYVVEDGWFEIQLPSLQLMATDRIPAGQGAWRFITGASLPASLRPLSDGGKFSASQLRASARKASRSAVERLLIAISGEGLQRRGAQSANAVHQDRVHQGRGRRIQHALGRRRGSVSPAMEVHAASVAGQRQAKRTWRFAPRGLGRRLRQRGRPRPARCTAD